MNGESKRSWTRRRFLGDAFLLSFFGAWIGLIAQAVVRFLLPPEKPLRAGGRVRIAKKLAEIPNSSGMLFRFHESPALLIKGPSGELSAFLAICPHLGCTVEYDAKGRRIVCPCHMGIFDLEGRNVDGPPRGPLVRLDVRLQGDEIYVSAASRKI